MGFANSIQQIISTNASGASSVFAADLDGDGDIDVLSASYDNKIAWYENQGLNMGFASSVHRSSPLIARDWLTQCLQLTWMEMVT